MPEAPNPKLHPHPTRSGDPGRGDGTARDDTPAAPRYAELHCLSNFSFLRGASHPEELVRQAHELGYDAIAITDRNSLAGVVRAHVAAKEAGLHLLVGAEITPEDAPPLVLLAPDRAAYGRLARLITRGRLRTPKGACAIRMRDLEALGRGLIAIALPPRGIAAGIEGTRDRGERRATKPRSHEATKGGRGAKTRAASRRGSGERGNTGTREEEADSAFCAFLRRFRAIFGAESTFLAAELAYEEPDKDRLARLVRLSRAAGVPLVAANAVHYHVPERRYLQDVLTCVREQCTLADAGARLFPNAERHLRAREAIARRYACVDDPALIAAGRAALARTVEIARRCSFTLDELRYEYPHELVPPGVSAMEYLERLTWEGAEERYAVSRMERGSREEESYEATEPRSHGATEGRRKPRSHGGKGSHDVGERRAAAVLPENVRALLRAELDLIAELRYEHYFLTVHDLCRYARERGILCQGRGSAANSAVCYCLGVTAVDPTRHDLLFERFISRERNEPPDIDVDFEHERREEVFQYVYEKYGRERAAITAEVITYRPRSAIRDVGKALGLSLDCVDVLAKAVDWWDGREVPENVIHNAGLDPADRTVQMLVRLVGQLCGFPRHLSQHVGGFVITETPLCEIVPLENGAMPGRTFIEWDKDDIDALGILKVDCLALGMLTAISECFKLSLKLGTREQGNKGTRESRGSSNGETDVPRPGCLAEGPDRQSAKEGGVTKGGAKKRGNEGLVSSHAPSGLSCLKNESAPLAPSFPCSLDPCHEAASWLRGSSRSLDPSFPCSLTTIPPEDPAVYDMICAADTVGVFQIESRAQMSMLPRLRPRCFYDLVIEVAIVRPGPIQGGMVHPYLRRRDRLEEPHYHSEAVRQVLEKTLGVPIFQEQVMRLAVVAAGFTPGEADQLRRAMAAWRRSGSIERFQVKLVRGMLARGYSRAFAEQIYRQIQGFGEYGFPESHAASFALLVYASAWLKRHRPAAFLGGMLNAQPLGFYTPGQLVRDAQQHGVPVLPVDVNSSDWDCVLESRFAEGSRERGNEGSSEEGRREGTEPRSHEGKSGSNGAAEAQDPSQWGRAGPAVRLGFRVIRGLSEEKVRGLLDFRRQAGRITTLRSLARRPDVSRETLLRLAAADAFRSLGLSRRAALWRILALDRDEAVGSRGRRGRGDATLPLFADLEPDEHQPELPDMRPEEVVTGDYDAVGFSLNAHPLSLIRRDLGAIVLRRGRTERLAPEALPGQSNTTDEHPAEHGDGRGAAERRKGAARRPGELRIMPSEELRATRNGQAVAVAGLVTCRQRPSTAKGVIFMTLEDETGMANLVIRPRVWERNWRQARNKIAVIAEGTIERQGEVVHVMVRRLHDLSARLGALAHRSRDFH